MQNPFVADRDRYRRLAEAHAESYGNADPFPHVWIDDFLPPDLCRSLAASFPRIDDPAWKRFKDPTSLKLGTDDATGLPENVQAALSWFNSAAFLDFLERLTSIPGLIPDPWFEGGGLHQIPRGGFLKIHADFNRHEKLRLDRRLNAICYLNEDWRDDYGGHLELWPADMSACRQRILPVFNRLVVFNTTDFSYHGHPTPLTCPEDRTRKSLALYYYSNGRPQEEVSDAHTTLFQLRPEEQERQRTLGYRVRATCSRGLDGLASLAHKPSKLLRILANAVKPRY